MTLPAIAKATQDPARIQALVDAAEPRFRRAFETNLGQIKDGRRFNRVERLIQDGQFGQAIDESARIVAESISGEYVGVYQNAGFDASQFVTNAIGVAVNFDQVNTRAVSQMQANRLELIRGFTQGQRDATRIALTEGITRGLNPRDQARAFRDSIGLTAHQEQSVQNYRRLLEQGSSEALQRQLRDRRFDSTVRGATARGGGQALEPSQVDRMVGRYRERAIKNRSVTIARTESLRAVHQGAHEGFQQAIDAGHIRENQLVRTWTPARDDRVRDTHNGMRGQKRGHSEPFQSPSGASLMYPGDPSAPGSETIQCRCIATVRLDPTREQASQARSRAQPEPTRASRRRARPDFDPNNVRLNPEAVLDTLEEQEIDFEIGGKNIEVLITPEGLDTSTDTFTSVSMDFTVDGEFSAGKVTDPREGARIGLRVRRAFTNSVRSMPDGTVLNNTPFMGDGLGDDRARIYSSFGFGEIDEGGMQWAVVQGGRANPLTQKQLSNALQQSGLGELEVIR